MGGYKTITASAGYEFEITASNGRKWVVGEYAEGSDGYISFAQYPEWAVLKPTIELVPIKEPEPVPEAYKTVTASEGWEFRVTRTEHILSGDRTLYCTQYTMNESGWCDFLPEEGLYSIKNPTIELVEVTNATSEPEPEPDSEPISFEFPLPDACKKGDWIRIDLQGHWSLLRYATVPTRTSISQGQAEPSRKW